MTSSPKKSSQPVQFLKVPNTNELLDHSKYSNGIPYYNIYPYNNSQIFSEPVKIPVASRSYEISRPGHVQESSQNIYLSSMGEKGLNVRSESNEAAAVNLKQSEKNSKHFGKTITEAKYFHLLKIMRLAKYSILAAAFSDVLTLGFPLFIFSIVFALKGLKMLKVLNLMAFLIYLMVSSAPYVFLAYYVNRPEVYVVCGIIISFKAVSFYVISLFLVKFCMVQEEVRSRLMIDFNSNPGKNCICCC
jgi:hypothetical protein